MQACARRAPKEPSFVHGGKTPHLPFADSPGDFEFSCLTLGLTTSSSSFLTGSTTRTEASLSPFATILLLPGRPASSSLSDSEKIPEEKNQWEDRAIRVLQDCFTCDQPFDSGSVILLLCVTTHLLGWRAKQTFPSGYAQRGIYHSPQRSSAGSLVYGGEQRIKR